MRGSSAVVAALAALVPAVVTAQSSDMPIWPYPKDANLGSGSIAISPTLSFVCTSNACTTSGELSRAFARYRSLIFYAGEPAATQGPAVSRVSVSVQALEDLQLGMNESYELQVSTDGTASILSPSQWGALRALETLSQLVVWQRGSSPSYTFSRVPLSIKDSPRFPWRGVLVDSSRHFQSLSVLRKTLDAMSFNKYNTLHWHLIDDQAWPLQSDKYPNFAAAGAYDVTAMYSKDDVRSIVQYARDRGIRVVPGARRVAQTDVRDHVGYECAH